MVLAHFLKLAIQGGAKIKFRLNSAHSHKFLSSQELQLPVST